MHFSPYFRVFLHASCARRDVLEGWARMGLCPTLRSLLNKGGYLTPAGKACALALLCRLAHRAPDLAIEVGDTPMLLDALRACLEVPAAEATLLHAAAAPDAAHHTASHEPPATRHLALVLCRRHRRDR